MLAVSSKVRRGFAGLWWWLRQLSGDAAYESYLRSARAGRSSHRSGNRRNNCRGNDGTAILSRQEFYLDSLRRKYSGVNRCC